MQLKKHLGLFALLFCSSLYAAGPNLYKYTDENGIKIISTNLPSEAANRGYSIVSPRGNVIEVIKPKLSDEAIAKLEAQAIKDKEKEIALKAQKVLEEKQARKDTLLLKMFSSAQDIERSRDEKVQSIQVQMGITSDNLVRLQEQLTRAKQVKAAHEAQNQAIPLQLEETIKDTKIQLEDNRIFLDRKEQEKEQIKSQYHQMLERFKKVKSSHKTPNASAIE